MERKLECSKCYRWHRYGTKIYDKHFRFLKHEFQTKDSKITKTIIREGNIGEKQGWCFEVYWDNRPYPNFISSLTKTEIGAKRNLTKYIKTGKFSWYGNAE